MYLMLHGDRNYLLNATSLNKIRMHRMLNSIYLTVTEFQMHVIPPELFSFQQLQVKASKKCILMFHR